MDSLGSNQERRIGYKHSHSRVSQCLASTPQPLYNTIMGVQDNLRVSYPNRVITRVKCIGYIAK